MEKLAAFDEQLDRVSAKIHYADGGFTVSGGDAIAAPGRIRFDGSYDKTEAIKFNVDAENVPGSRIKMLNKVPMRPDGSLTAKLSGIGRMVRNEFELTAVNGTASGHNVTLNGDSVGDITLSAQTKGTDLMVHASANVRGAKLEGDGVWKLEGDDPGTITIQAQRVDLNTARRVYMIGGTDEQKNETLPFEGFVDGRAKYPLHCVNRWTFEPKSRSTNCK